MEYLKKCKKQFLLSSLMIIILLIFTACGAVVNTDMKIDKNFKGQRTITAYIKKSDLKSYVSKGADGIEAVIEKYIPESLSYKRDDKTSGDVEFTFIINFNNLEDYTNKIVDILNKNPDNMIKAKILYNNKNNEFNKNLLFKENFSSNDLLAWLVYGLKTDNIVSNSSVSQWMEEVGISLTIDNQKYNVNSNISINESESTSFDSINILTEILENGSLKRTMTFAMNSNNLKILKDRGLVVSDYLRKLSPETADFKENKDENGIKYIISFESKTSKELSASTDKLLNSKDTIFTVKYSSYEDKKNTVRIDVEEYLDASYYIDFDSNKLESDIRLYDNAQIDFINTNNSLFIEDIVNKEIIKYYPNFQDAYKFTFSLPIKFKNLSLSIEVNKDNITEKLAMSVRGNVAEEMAKVIESNIKSSVDSDKIELDVQNEEDAITYLLSLEASIEELSHEFKSFLSNYTSSDVNHEILYSEIKSRSAFRTENSLNVNADFEKMNADSINFYCKASSAKKLEIVEASMIEELNNSTNKSIAAKLKGGTLSFYAIETETKLAPVIILIISIIALMIITLVIISNRSKIINLFKNIKIKQKA